MEDGVREAHMTPGINTCGTRLLYSTQSSPYLPSTNYTQQNSIKIAAGEVLLRAAVLITQSPVYDHDREEGRVKVRQRGVEAARQTPARGHYPVCEVVWLAAETVPGG